MTNRTHLFAALGCCLFAGVLLGGCRPACDIVPTQSLANLRIIDAINDVPYLTVRIDSGKIFDKAYYNLDDYTESGAAHPLKYMTQYQDGSGLSAGVHHLTAYGTRGEKLVDTTLTLTEQAETLVYAGLESGPSKSHPRVLQLYDDWNFDCKTCPSHLRFVEAVPDLPDSGLDVYFLTADSSPTAYPNISNPNIRIRFGQITDEHGRGTGTGKSFSDYVVLGSAPVTLVTLFKDTSITGTIVRVPYGLNTAGIFNTILIRGRGAPVDTQASIALVVLRDGLPFGGATSIDYRLFGARLVNATRLDSISLMIHNAVTEAQKGPRNNLPQQSVVFNITPDSVSDYWRLTRIFDDTAIFTITRTPDDTVSLYNFARRQTDDERFTIIAMETTPLAAGNHVISAIRLNDTLDLPATANLARVRFVNASPDHASITVTGPSGTIASLGGKGSIVTADIPIGPQVLTVSDGTNTGTVTLSNLSNDTPVTVIFSAASATNKFPYGVAIK